MKKLVRKLAIFLIPFTLALVFFFVFEPYDYFAVKGDAVYGSMPLSSMRQLKKERPANIILGDSRMANIDTDYVEQITGEQWQMMGFGGAQVGECVELFWYSAAHTDLEKVVFGVSFYTSSGTQGPGRIPVIEKRADSLWAFMTNANYWLESINTAKYKAVNMIAGALGRDDLIYYPEDPTSFDAEILPDERGVKYRRDLEDYCEILSGNMQKFSLEESTLASLVEIAEYCDANGIELIFVFPPMQECVFELVTEPLGIDGPIARYKDALKKHATVYDCEFRNEFTCCEDHFRDGFHLVGQDRKQFIDAVFLGGDSPMIIRYGR